MEFEGYSRGNFNELYEVYRVVRDRVHNKGLNDDEIPRRHTVSASAIRTFLGPIPWFWRTREHTRRGEFWTDRHLVPCQV